MMNENFEDLKGLELVNIKKISTYHISTVICLFFLLIMILATFIWVVLPIHNIALIIGFVCGIIGGIYNIVLEFVVPEKHLHWIFKVPEDYKGWKYLFLVAKCISYEPEENIITLQFEEEMDRELAKIIAELEK